MRITSLVENTTKSELKTKHGLSLYIETKSHKILFDLGSDSTLFENAMKRNIDISKVDTVIISHGHFDHGGALKKFLDIKRKPLNHITVKPYFLKYQLELIVSLNLIGKSNYWMVIIKLMKNYRYLQ